MQIDHQSGPNLEQSIKQSTWNHNVSCAGELTTGKLQWIEKPNISTYHYIPFRWTSNRFFFTDLVLRIFSKALFKTCLSEEEKNNFPGIRGFSQKVGGWGNGERGDRVGCDEASSRVLPESCHFLLGQPATENCFLRLPHIALSGQAPDYTRTQKVTSTKVRRLE